MSLFSCAVVDGNCLYLPSFGLTFVSLPIVIADAHSLFKALLNSNVVPPRYGDGLLPTGLCGLRARVIPLPLARE
jgi:hypothetical protein